MLINVNGKNINYREAGSGEPILLVHGWGGNMESLRNIAKLFELKFRVISLDLPGFGQSDRPGTDWGVQEYAKVLVDFIDQLKLKPVIFFGHSFGGSLGIFIAAYYPDYCKKIILSGPSYKRSRRKSKLSRYLKWLPDFPKKMIYRIFFPNSDLFKVPGLENNFKKIVNRDLSPILKSVKTPVLILWGENDRQTPVKQAEYLQKKIKKSSLKIFPGIGHDLPIRYPDLVYKEVSTFL